MPESKTQSVSKSDGKKSDDAVVDTQATDTKVADTKATDAAATDQSVDEAQTEDASLSKYDQKTAGQVTQNLHGEVFVSGPDGQEPVAPMEDVPDDLSSLDATDPMTRAQLKAYRNQIDVANTDPNMVKKIDAFLRNNA